MNRRRRSLCFPFSFLCFFTLEFFLPFSFRIWFKICFVFLGPCPICLSLPVVRRQGATGSEPFNRLASRPLSLGTLKIVFKLGEALVLCLLNRPDLENSSQRWLSLAALVFSRGGGALDLAGAHSSGLGHSLIKGAQMQIRSWAWPINYAPWKVSGPLSLRSLRPTSIRGELEKAHYAIRLIQSNRLCRQLFSPWLHRLPITVDVIDSTLPKFLLPWKGEIFFIYFHLAALLGSGSCCSSSEPKPESVSSSTVSHQTLAWQWIVILRLLLSPTITRLRYSYLQGRGHQVSVVSICLVCLGNSYWPVFIESIVQFAWSELIHLLDVCFIENIAQMTWSDLINLLAVCCNQTTHPNLVIVRYLRLNGRGHRLCLGSELLDWYGLIASNRGVHIISFLWILVPVSSFKKRVQFFPSSFLSKERTFPSVSSTMESVFQSSRVLKTIRAMFVLLVRSPLMAIELDIDFISIIYEVFCQKLPVFAYANHRHSIPFLLCYLMVVTSKNYGIKPPLVSLF